MGISSSAILHPKTTTAAGPNVIAGNVLGHNNCPRRLYANVQLQVNAKTYNFKALIDTGSDYSLLDRDTAAKLNLTTTNIEPIPMETVDGTPLPTGSPTSLVDATITVNGFKTKLQTYIIKSPHAPIILGLDWLKIAKPIINWNQMTLLPKQVKVSEAPDIQINSSFGSTKGNTVNIDIATNESKDKNTTIPETPATINAKSEDTNTEPIAAPYDNPAENIDESEETAPEIKEILHKLPYCYHKYANVFSKSESETLPQHRKYDLPIDIIPEKAVPWGPIYSLTEPELTALRSYIDENLAKGYIRASKSPAGAPIFFVKKKSGELRPVVDYRGLNSVTIKNRYPLPLINEMLTRFKDAKIFTKIDLRGAYNLVRIRNGDEWKTAFRCRFGHFEYLVMPFGLTNAPAIFQHLINDILRDLLDVYCIAYLDDILIYSSSPEEHVKHVATVLERLQQNFLYAKLEKCEFSTTTVSFLGYLISTDGLRMEPARVASIETWPTPTNVKQLQQFLGFANFYRMFIHNYTRVIHPMLQLLKKDTTFTWTSACEDAFAALKHAFLNAPIIRHPDSKKRFYLETDASDYAIGGILSQKDDDNILRPVAFYSRKLTAPEINYQIHDKELLAIVCCFYQWRAFLVGSELPISVLTDHRNLIYFTTTRKLNRRQFRWSLFLADFDFEIIYRAGKEGEKPDALSRRHDYTLQQHEVQTQFQVVLDKNRFLVGSTLVIPTQIQKF
jgi:hypothetical protein